MFVGIDTRMFHFCMGAKDEKFRIMCMNTDRYKIIYKNGPLYALVLAHIATTQLTSRSDTNGAGTDEPWGRPMSSSRKRSTFFG